MKEWIITLQHLMQKTKIKKLAIDILYARNCQYCLHLSSYTYIRYYNFKIMKKWEYIANR